MMMLNPARRHCATSSGALEGVAEPVETHPSHSMLPSRFKWSTQQKKWFLQSEHSYLRTPADMAIRLSMSSGKESLAVFYNFYVSKKSTSALLGLAG